MTETMRGFRIIRDYLEGDSEDSRAGYEADRWRDGELLPEGPVVEFRLYDDDEILYYEGVFGDAPGDLDIQDEAVLNFGMWDAGCTTIKVKRNGEWIQEIG